MSVAKLQALRLLHQGPLKHPRLRPPQRLPSASTLPTPRPPPSVILFRAQQLRQQSLLRLHIQPERPKRLSLAHRISQAVSVLLRRGKRVAPLTHTPFSCHIKSCQLPCSGQGSCDQLSRSTAMARPDCCLWYHNP